jgi:uncharacterized spore protein YtfJ
MEMHFEELLGKVTDFIKSEAKTETVIGETFKLGEFECVPVIRIGMGFGSGGANAHKSSEGESGGAGAGIGIEPIGFLVTREKEISFLAAKKTSNGIAAAFEKVPDILEKIIAKKDKVKA